MRLNAILRVQNICLYQDLVLSSLKPRGQHATCWHIAGVKGPHRRLMIPDYGFDGKTSCPLPPLSYNLLCSGTVSSRLLLLLLLSLSYASIRGCLTNLSSSRVFLNPRYVKALASSKASHAVLPLSTSQENYTLCSDLCLPLLPHPPSVSLTVCGLCTPTRVCFPRWSHPVVMPCSHD